jgi:hypothetical protein
MGGCADLETPTAPEPASAASRVDQHLPYGVPIPPGDIRFTPEPYNPEKHGPPLPFQFAGKTLATHPGTGPAPRRNPSVETGALSIFSTNPSVKMENAFQFHDSGDWYGVHALHSAWVNLDVPHADYPGDLKTLYAPTHLPPGTPCLEMTSIYERAWADSIVPKRWFGFWDWCGSIGWIESASFDILDEEFQRDFIRTYQGVSTIAANIVGILSLNCWYGHLYNYYRGGWTQVAAQCGTSQVPSNGRGWSAWESYGITSPCPVIQSVTAFDVRLAATWLSSWVPFTDYPAAYQHSVTDFSAGCWLAQGYYTMDHPVPGAEANSWRANTPYP